ncbi:MAG: hypothetical protein IJR88_01725 [Clostridia bacterium]|nr:hypothetical protein [Clostridia bacterium]
MEISALRYAVFGGDARQSFLTEILRRKGLTVDSFGVPDQPDTGSWKKILERADCLFLPLPITRDGVRLFCEDREDIVPVRLDRFFDCAGKILFAGRIPPSFRASVSASGGRIYDYFDSESLQILNALPTAEGAIFTAMKELPVTLCGACIAVIGYGRIGRLLTDRLVALGSSVTVYERKEDRHPYIRFSKAAASPFFDAGGKKQLLSLPRDCRVLFNTVPEPIFTREVLEFFPKNCLFVDLASPPGGLDPVAASELNINRVWATALPGKYAPESAASYLAEEALSIIEKATL